MIFSKRALSISPSPTLGITARAKALRAEGIDIIGFGAGEPDFDTPDHIKEAAVAAINEGFTKYTPTAGIPELKQAICDRFRKDSGLEYEPAQIVVSCGAKHSIYNIIQVLCEEGDEVIVPAPYWVSYPEQVRLAGAKPVIMETDESSGFKITANDLSGKINAGTKLLILNSPGNPTGAMYFKEELEALAYTILEAGIWVISDEIYDKIVYDGHQQASIASLGPEIKRKTLVVNGVSKAYSMTGWRIGYTAGDRDIIARISNLQDHSTSNPTSIAQKASLAALAGDQEPVYHMVSEFESRRNYMLERLNSIPGISCLKPSGAFYAFVNIYELLGKSYKGQSISDSMQLTELLLNEAKVAVLPGSPFGAEGYLRLSFATSMENIAAGMDRIEEFVKGVAR